MSSEQGPPGELPLDGEAPRRRAWGSPSSTPTAASSRPARRPRWCARPTPCSTSSAKAPAWPRWPGARRSGSTTSPPNGGGPGGAPRSPPRGCGRSSPPRWSPKTAATAPSRSTRRRPAPFGPVDERALLSFADRAAVLVAHARAGERAGRFSAQFKDTLRERDLIAMAKGFLMGHDGLGEDAAFDRLLALARAHGTSPAEAAARVVAPAPREG